MKAGKPLVFTATLPVLENKWYGTQGGFNVQAVFVGLDVSTNFEKTLPISTQEELKSNELFAGHPRYHFSHHGLEVFQLKRPISNLLTA